MRVGPLNLKWLPRRNETDPYWDLFVRTPPVDPNNLVAESLRHVTEGNVFPIKTDVHSPQIMSSHVKEFARFLGADLCGVAPLGRPADPPDLPFGVVVVMAADYDMREAQGIGGQAPMLKGAFVTFVLGAWIRESGYRATRSRSRKASSLPCVPDSPASIHPVRCSTPRLDRISTSRISSAPICRSRRYGSRSAVTTYVITEACVGVKDATCVDVCPVACIHTTPEAPQFYIDPEISSPASSALSSARSTPSTWRRIFPSTCSTTSRSTPSSSASGRPRLPLYQPSRQAASQT